MAFLVTLAKRVGLTPPSTDPLFDPIRTSVRPNQPVNAQPVTDAPVRRAPMQPQSQSTIPRPSEVFDNWTSAGLLIALGVIAVILLRKRN